MFSRITKRFFSTQSTPYPLANQIITVLGYGSQGRSQSLNMRDQGHLVILGLREKGESWQKALNDKWLPGTNLFNIDDSLQRGTIIHNLLSDTAQMDTWGQVTKHLKPGHSLSFSHGLGIAFQDQTGMVPPKNVDVFMVAPKGVGPTVRNHFLEGRSINASWAVHQDFTGNAKLKCLELAKAIGCDHTFPTTFEKEVYSDLVGERCVLMGLIQGAFKAQFDVLRENGHSAEEAFNETVEEALESLYPLVSKNGMDHLYENCSMVAQRGALDWAPRFEKAVKPVIEECYNRVKDGSEMKRVLEMRNDPNYRNVLNKELKEMREQELWKTGNYVREHRSIPKPQQTNTNKYFNEEKKHDFYASFSSLARGTNSFR